MAVTITLPRVIVERAKKEAEKLGISIEEYFLDLVSRGLDPKEKSIEYIEATKELLEQAREELRKGSVRQATEKTLGATALAVKAYAYWKEGKRLASHGKLWEYVEVLADDIGEWVRNVWNEASGMHICFYEGWCKPKQVEAALNQIGKLVREIDARIKRRTLGSSHSVL